MKDLAVTNDKKEEEVNNGKTSSSLSLSLFLKSSSKLKSSFIPQLNSFIMCSILL